MQRLKSKIAEASEQKGVTVDEEMHQGLQQQIMEHESGAILKAFQPDTFQHIRYKLPILPFCSQVFRGNGPISVHHARREGVLEPSNLSGPTGAVFWLSEAERGDP